MTASQTLPGEERERLTLHHVGGRNYVRGLELAGKMRERFPHAKLTFRFRQPLACEVLVTKDERAGWSCRVTAETAGAREDLFIVNTNAACIHRAAETPLPPHLVLSFSEWRQRYLVFGGREDGILDVVFETHRQRTPLRPAIASMRLAFAPAGPVHLVSVHIVPRTKWVTADIFLNGRRWAEFVCARQS